MVFKAVELFCFLTMPFYHKYLSAMFVFIYRMYVCVFVSGLGVMV